MSETWFSLSRTDDIEILAREWKPGDGVTCSFASHQRREPCGPPVAVVETLKYRRSYVSGRLVAGDDIDKRTVRGCCAEHLAGRIGKRYGNARAEMITRATKRAVDEVVTKNWKQYQGAYAKAITEEREALLEGIPEGLRGIFLASDDAEDGDAA